MKTVLLLIFKVIAQLVSYALPYRFFGIFNLFINTVIWNSAKRKFGAMGKGSYIEWPFVINDPENIFIGDNFSAATQLRIETFNSYKGQSFTPNLIIGDNVILNNDCHIGCINRIEIGNNVLGASRIFITDHYHGQISSEDLDVLAAKRPLYSKGAVIIKENVWIGEGVVILPNVTIGENAIIGANSVVNKDVPANAVVAGMPAKIIKIL